MRAEETPPDQPIDVLALCRSAAEGDIAALETLIWAHRGRLWGFARRKIGPDWQGVIDPDDILQDAYIDIFTGIARFKAENEDSFYRWATRLIEHRFIDRVRALRRKKRDVAREVQGSPRSVSRHESFLASHLRDTATPSRALRREDAVNALMTCIAKLPDDWRIAVQRVHLDQEPLDAVAADMGRSEDAVRRLVSRAVERLAECMRSASRFLSSHD